MNNEKIKKIEKILVNFRYGEKQREFKGEKQKQQEEQKRGKLQAFLLRLEAHFQPLIENLNSDYVSSHTMDFRFGIRRDALAVRVFIENRIDAWREQPSYIEFVGQLKGEETLVSIKTTVAELTEKVSNEDVKNIKAEETLAKPIDEIDFNLLDDVVVNFFQKQFKIK